MDATELLKREENYSRIPYRDTRGVLTIGYGLNLEGRGLEQDEALWLLKRQVNDAHETLLLRESFYGALDEVRQAALISMVFQLGWNGYLAFIRMRSHLAKHEFALAAAEGLRSEWAKQTPNRAERQMKMIETGKWPA